MPQHAISLDFVIMEELLEDEIIDLLNNNFGDEVEKLINNAASKGADTYCNIMFSAIDKAKKKENSVPTNNAHNNEKDDAKCVICSEKQKNVLFLPCKHVATCVECSHKILGKILYFTYLLLN